MSQPEDGRYKSRGRKERSPEQLKVLAMAREKAKLVIAEKTKIKKEMARAELPVEDSASSFNTSNLVSNVSTLEVIGIDGGSHEINIVDVIDAKTIKVDTDLSNWLGSVDENGNVITETTTTTLTPEKYEELEDKDGYVEEDGSWTKTTTTNVGKNIVVKGQVVDDFKILNKDYLWTIATSALQEVDRQLQAEKNKVASLEARISALEKK